MSERKFTEQHEWVRVEGDVATCGITEYAAQQLGDVVYVELPKAGQQVTQFKQAATVESVKAASEVYAPLSGQVTEANDAIVSDPAKVNTDPMNAAWFFKLRIKDKGELAKLMSQDKYNDYIKGLH